jgi:hypothetical protein
MKCSVCNEEGHNKSSSKCNINKDKDLILLNNIKPLIFNGDEKEDIILKFNITKYKLKQIKSLISDEEYILNINLKDEYLDLLINTLVFNCEDCNINKYEQSYKWNDKIICYDCIKFYNQERLLLIKKINKLDIICKICSINYNRKNLINDFYSNNLSISNMINTNTFIEGEYLCSCCYNISIIIKRKIRLGNQDINNKIIKDKIDSINTKIKNLIYEIKK